MSIALEREGRVAIVTLDRPATRNALSDDFFAELAATVQALDREPDLGCVVIAGHDRAFSTGADVRELSSRTPVEVLLGRRAELWRALRDVRTPLLAAVSGHCLGGGFELALACDAIIASPTARFGLPETSLGLIPGGGGTQLLVRLLGRALATDVVLTGRRLTAQEALQFGIVARLAGEEGWLAAAKTMAGEVAGRPSVGQLLAKQALTAAFELPLSGGIALERSAFQVALASADAREGLAAFVEGRDPHWSGR